MGKPFSREELHRSAQRSNPLPHNTMSRLLCIFAVSLLLPALVGAIGCDHDWDADRGSAKFLDKHARIEYCMAWDQGVVARVGFRLEKAQAWCTEEGGVKHEYVAENTLEACSQACANKDGCTRFQFGRRDTANLENNRCDVDTGSRKCACLLVSGDCAATTNDAKYDIYHRPAGQVVSDPALAEQKSYQECVAEKILSGNRASICDCGQRLLNCLQTDLPSNSIGGTACPDELDAAKPNCEDCEACTSEDDDAKDTCQYSRRYCTPECLTCMSTSPCACYTCTGEEATKVCRFVMNQLNNAMGVACDVMDPSVCGFASALRPALGMIVMLAVGLWALMMA